MGRAKMDNYSVMMSAAAAEDIGGIADYIANTLLEPETAAKLIGRLKTAVKSLETMPERHPLLFFGGLILDKFGRKASARG